MISPIPESILTNGGWVFHPHRVYVVIVHPEGRDPWITGICHDPGSARKKVSEHLPPRGVEERCALEGEYGRWEYQEHTFDLVRVYIRVMPVSQYYEPAPPPAKPRRIRKKAKKKATKRRTKKKTTRKKR